MNCIFCKGDHTQVTHTFKRVVGNREFIGRYRKCAPCNLSFLTLEDGCRCKNCNSRTSRVRNTINAGTSIKRSRQCHNCGLTRTTYERVTDREDSQGQQESNPYLK